MGKRLSRWFWFNFVFALLPLILGVLIRFLGNKLDFQAIASSPEVLFFSLMISATSIGDAIENRKIDKNETLFTNMWCALLFSGFFSAGLYGCLLVDTIFNLNLAVFRSNLLYFSILLAVASLTVSFFTQLWIAKVEGSA
ncbi:MAG TPA: hypothetical protein VF538_16055 [Pyrinomonadaceae bacterium]|jgi:hypothetical protein